MPAGRFLDAFYLYARRHRMESFRMCFICKRAGTGRNLVNRRNKELFLRTGLEVR